MSELGNMVVRLRADLGDYKQGMTSGAAAAKQFGRDVEGALQGGAAKAEQAAAAVGRSSEAMAASMGRIGTAAEAVNGKLDGMMRTLGGIGLALTISEMARMSDAATNLSARIGLVSSSAVAASQTQAALYDIAQRTRQQWAGVAQTYSYLAKAGQELGISQDRILRVTENTSKAIALSGGAAESTQAALVQFSQGLASGTLRGEELNSVLEQAPRLAQALADGLGVTIGELRKLGEEGKLVPEQLINALDRAGKQLSAEFASMPMTVEQSFTQLQNALMKRMTDMNESAGIFRRMAEGISLLANNLDYVTAALTGLMVAKVSEWALNTAASFARKADAAAIAAQAVRLETAATVAATEADAARTAAVLAGANATNAAIGVARAEQTARLASANATLQSAEAAIAAATSTGALSGAVRVLREAEVQATAATAARAAAMAELALLGQQQVRVNLEIAAATEANAAAQRALATAQTAGAAGASLAGRALGLLGGPIGAVVTVLGLGVTAWEVYSATQRASAREAVDSSGKQVSVSEQTTQQIIEDLNRQIAKYRERNAVRDGAAEQEPVRLTDQKARLAELRQRTATVTPEQRAANPYDARFIEMARLESAILEAETEMRADRVRKLQAEDEKFTRQLKGINENYEKYITVQKGLLAEGAISQETYVARVKEAHKKWAGGAKDAEEAGKAFQNALSGEIAAIEQQGKLREAALKRELTNVERLHRTGQITEEEALTRSFDAREKALGDELSQHRRLEELAAGKKELAAREKYHGERVRVEAELTALGQERINAMQDQADKLYRLQKEQDDKTLLGLEQRIVAVRQETELYGRLPSVIEAVTVARLQERRAAIAMLDPMSEQLKAIDAEIDARSRLREALYAKEATEQRYNLAKKTAEDWNRVADQIGQGLTDSLYRAFEAGRDFGRTFLDGLKNMAKTTLLRIPLQFVQQGISGLLGLAFGGGGTADGSLSGGASGVSSALNAVQGLSSAGKALSMLTSWTGWGLPSSIASPMATAMGGDTLGNLIALKGASSGSTAGLGSGMAGMFAGPQAIVGAVLAGMAINDSLFTKGWDIQKGGISYGSTLKADLLGTALSGGLLAPGTISLASTGVKFADKALRGLGLSDRMASLISGSAIVSALFGRKAPEVQSAGLAGDFTASGFNGSQYVDWLAKGGWFRSDKRWTDYSALDQQQSDVLNGAVQSSLGLYRRLDKSAGGTGLEDRLGSFKYSVRRDMRGENAVEQLLTDLSEEMGRQLIPELTRLQRSGESITDTAKRLTDVFDATNVAASVFGKTTAQAFGDVGLATAAARQRLVDLAGGLDSFNSKVADYYAGYFSDEEKITRLRDQLREQFAELGLVMPATRQQFRELLESFNLQFEWGQDTVNGLLALAPAFGQVADAAAAAEAAMKAFSDQVKDFQQQLRQGDLSTLTPEQQYQEARKRYEEVSAKAAGGDETARSQWTQIAQAFLEASRAYYASGDRYAADFDKVQGFRPDGSHANGLGFVPFDGYVAELHRGERVLTRSENALYSAPGPDWSKFGRENNAALVAEVKALRGELAAMRQERAVSTQAVEQQTAVRHAEAMQVQRDQRRLTQTLVDNQ